MKIIKLTTILGFIVLVISLILHMFMNNSLEYYNNTSPKMDIKDYFNGPLKAWGIVQDWRGRVVSRFDIKMIGQWEGDVGTLTEHFDYYDGKTQERMWTIKKLNNANYEGTASDVTGKAVGKTIGSVARWDYVLNLSVNNVIYSIRFDDWMWLMNDGVVINRSYLKKFGIKVSELTIFIQKQKP